ncbi:MAG: 16S rRNA (cytidine(1402)-2'-O)-methyltransferase [Candidatus Pacebacteria bacterium]|nr:16S rRNA (cytidine(1402)-2'-O)-methyltransferase [Candidatus Paceibacterota bacterium]
MSNLYIIATPIGNLEDITLRALRVLKEADLILCEDTRQTKKLLAKYEINSPTMSYHQHSKLNKINKIVDLLECGKNLALVSDAGTPGISDPGNKLIEYLVENKIDVKIIPIPGPSAVISALCISGFPTDNFIFLGFVPHKKGRQTFFENLAKEKRTAAFYESPHRIIKTLESMKKYIPEKEIAVCRELTKIYETTYRGKPDEVAKKIAPDQVKGEFVVVVN